MAFPSACAVLGALAGCSSTGGGDDSDPSADCPSLTSGCPATPPSWQNEVQPLVATYCTPCHGNGDTEQSVFDSTTYRSVYLSRSELGTVIVECSMPPANAPAPDRAQRQTLLSWVACDAPDN